MILIVSDILLVVFLVILCGFFAGSETALTGLSMQQIQNVLARKPRLSAALTYWQKNPSQMLTFFLLGNNGAYIGASVAATSLAFRLNAWSGVRMEILLVLLPAALTVATIFAGELFPKIYGKQNAERVAERVIGVVFKGTRISMPVIQFFVFISDNFIRLCGGKRIPDDFFITSSELKRMFVLEQEASSTEAAVQVDVPADTREMLKKLVDFSHTRVEEIMVPRTQMFGLDIKLGRDKIMREILIQRYSRVPIYEGNLDNIIGIIYSRDLIASMRNKELILLQDMLRPVFYTPEMARVSGVMHEFKKGRHHMAIVVDQYGGTAGLITIEDLMEEIVGEIYDEYDEHESTIQILTDGSFLIWAGEDIDRINEELKLKLPDDQYETLAALALDVFGKIPRPGETRKFGSYKLEIIESDRRRIYKIRISKII